MTGHSLTPVILATIVCIFKYDLPVLQVEGNLSLLALRSSAPFWKLERKNHSYKLFSIILSIKYLQNTFRINTTKFAIDETISL